jgi:predicted transposase/invertase (TIGR01784 family)
MVDCVEVVYMGGEEEHFLSAKNDFLFKRIFGNEKTTEPLRSLLRAILRVEVSEVEIQATELPRYNDSEKLGILDVKAVIDNGQHVNIEMQVCYQAYFMKRTQFYLSKLYDMQIGAGDAYSDLRRAIVINILCDSKKYIFPDDEWHNTYIFKEIERNTPMPEGMMEMHFIELEKMIQLGNIDESDELTRWVLFMNANSAQEMKVIAKHDPAICKAYTIVEEVAKSKEERAAYEARQAFIRDQITREHWEEEKRKEARSEGWKEGLSEGWKKGQIQTAKAMISAGVDIETVCKVTGLSEKELKE